MAKRKTLKCSKCDRKFSMAAHLARHMSTTHGAKKAATSSRKRRVLPAERVAGSAASVQGGFAASGFEDLIDELRAYRRSLDAQRQQLDENVAAIDAALTVLGAAITKPVVARHKRGKGPSAGTLKDHIARVLRGRSKGLSRKDITVAVLKAGYKSKSKTLNHAISKALADMKNVSRVGRGVYRLR